MKNVCGVDKLFRIGIGVGLIILGITIESWLLGLLGSIPLFTAIVSFCPVNSALKKNSCKIANHRKGHSISK